jgi:hypothetical protein
MRSGIVLSKYIVMIEQHVENPYQTTQIMVRKAKWGRPILTAGLRFFDYESESPGRT